MSEQLTYPKIAAVILAEVRAIYPNGRKPDPEITQSWARALQRSRRVYPAVVWREAVTVWSISHSEVPTPHDIITAAGQVVGQWELDPQRKHQLEMFRAKAIDARRGASHGAVEALEASRAGSLPGGRKREYREIMAGIAQRARDRRIAEREVAGSGELFADMNKQPGDSPENGS